MTKLEKIQWSVRYNVNVVDKPTNDSAVQWSQDSHLFFDAFAKCLISDTGASCCDGDQTIHSLEVGILQVLIEFVENETPCNLGDRRPKGTSNDINLFWLGTMVFPKQRLNDVFSDFWNCLEKKKPNSIKFERLNSVHLL